MHIIVGVDAGKTSAIACLTLDGHLAYSAHKTFAGDEWIISSIRGVGIPSIVATDRKIPSRMVKRVNAAFNSRLYCPDKEISVMEKRALAKTVGIKDQHERDAYAAAVKAYRAHANKLKQAEHMSRENRVEDVDRIKAKIINRYSINEAITGKKANRS